MRDRRGEGWLPGRQGPRPELPSVSSQCCLVPGGLPCASHMPPLGPHVLQPRCRVGCGVGCCQPGARGDRLRRGGICLGCCRCPDTVSGRRSGHILCSGEQAVPAWRWQPSSGLQAAPATALGQGVLLPSGPPRAAVFGEEAQLRRSSWSGSFPHQIMEISGAGTSGHLRFRRQGAAMCLQMRSPRAWCSVTLTPPLSEQLERSTRSRVLMKTAHLRSTSSGSNLGGWFRRKRRGSIAERSLRRPRWHPALQPRGGWQYCPSGNGSQERVVGLDQEGGLLVKLVAVKSEYRKTSSALDLPRLRPRGGNVFLLEETRLGNGDPLESSVRGLLPRARGPREEAQEAAGSLVLDSMLLAAQQAAWEGWDFRV